MSVRDKRFPAAARSGALAGVPSGLTVVAGIWLMVAATMFDYRTATAGLDGRWIELLSLELNGYGYRWIRLAGIPWS